MEEMNKAYATFEERDRIASLGGGVDKIEKQHESGKMTARERIEMVSYPVTERWTVARCLFTLMTLPYMAVHCLPPMPKRL